MLLALGTGQQRARPSATVPAAREARQATTHDIAREVLLADRYLTALPPLAELVQVGNEDALQHGLDREPRQHPVECSLRGELVEALESASELSTDVDEAGTRALAGSRQGCLGGLRGGKAGNARADDHVVPRHRRLTSP